MRIIIFILLSVLSISLYAQVDKTQALAKQYYQTGDYEKAANLYEELWKKDQNNLYYYTSLYNSYLRINAYDDAEKLVSKQIKKNKEDRSYQIDLGYLYSQNNQSKEAEKIYKEVVDNLEANQNQIRIVANKFIGYREVDFAIESYLKGRELLKDKSLFGFELANVYLQNNKAKEAVSSYLALLTSSPNYASTIKNIFTNNIDKENIQDEIETQLYGLIQKNPKNDNYPELLIWLFTHQEDYQQALIQAKALDKRNQEDGGRIIKLADNAVQEKQYDAAIDAFTYLQSKGEENRFYQTAKSGLMNAKKLKVTTTPNFNQEDITFLQKEYNSYLGKYGKNAATVNSIRELANLEAYYLKDIQKAITLLEEGLAIPNLKKKIKNEMKLDVGDYYVLYGDVWEATLLYAQVDKEEKDSPLGEEARYRNARLSYYKGEFEWAQAQLGILKGATTELIANNALDLSVFIMDNLGLDTTTATMQIFADAELLYRQNKNEEALSKLNNILTEYPGHMLSDDVYYQKATIYFADRNYEKAIENLEFIVTNHSEDILADNATFMLGDIYENYLGDIDKAMEYYKTIITDYSNSVLMVEARKRFRFLRGDDI